MSDMTIAVLADALHAERERSFRNPRPRQPARPRHHRLQDAWGWLVRRLAGPAPVAIHVPPHLRPDHPEVAIQAPMPDLAHRGVTLARACGA